MVLKETGPISQPAMLCDSYTCLTQTLQQDRRTQPGQLQQVATAGQENMRHLLVRRCKKLPKLQEAALHENVRINAPGCMWVMPVWGPSLMSLSVKCDIWGHSGAVATCAAAKSQTRQAGIAKLKRLAL